MHTISLPLSHRSNAMLRAVAANRAEMTLSAEPDLRIDGLLCCDQATARELAHAGLIRPAAPGLPRQWVRAVLTPDGHVAVRRTAPAA